MQMPTILNCQPCVSYTRIQHLIANKGGKACVRDTGSSCHSRKHTQTKNAKPVAIVVEQLTQTVDPLMTETDADCSFGENF